MKRMGKRVLSWLLPLVILAGLIPATFMTASSAVSSFALGEPQRVSSNANEYRLNVTSLPNNGTNYAKTYIIEVTGGGSFKLTSVSGTGYKFTNAITTAEVAAVTPNTSTAYRSVQCTATDSAPTFAVLESALESIRFTLGSSGQTVEITASYQTAVGTDIYYNGHFYQVSDKEMTWKAAMETSLNPSLSRYSGYSHYPVTITDLAENQVLVNFFKAEKPVWLGAVPKTVTGGTIAVNTTAGTVTITDSPQAVGNTVDSDDIHNKGNMYVWIAGSPEAGKDVPDGVELWNGQPNGNGGPLWLGYQSLPYWDDLGGNCWDYTSADSYDHAFNCAVTEWSTTTTDPSITVSYTSGSIKDSITFSSSLNSTNPKLGDTLSVSASAFSGSAITYKWEYEQRAGTWITLTSDTTGQYTVTDTAFGCRIRVTASGGSAEAVSSISAGAVTAVVTPGNSVTIGSTTYNNGTDGNITLSKDTNGKPAVTGGTYAAAVSNSDGSVVTYKPGASAAITNAQSGETVQLAASASITEAVQVPTGVKVVDSAGTTYNNVSGQLITVSSGKLTVMPVQATIGDAKYDTVAKALAAAADNSTADTIELGSGTLTATTGQTLKAGDTIKKGTAPNLTTNFTANTGDATINVDSAGKVTLTNGSLHSNGGGSYPNGCPYLNVVTTGGTHTLETTADYDVAVNSGSGTVGGLATTEHIEIDGIRFTGATSYNLDTPMGSAAPVNTTAYIPAGKAASLDLGKAAGVTGNASVSTAADNTSQITVVKNGEGLATVTVDTAGGKLTANDGTSSATYTTTADNTVIEIQAGKKLLTSGGVKVSDGQSIRINNGDFYVTNPTGSGNDQLTVTANTPDTGKTTVSVPANGLVNFNGKIYTNPGSGAATFVIDSEGNVTLTGGSAQLDQTESMNVATGSSATPVPVTNASTEDKKVTVTAGSPNSTATVENGGKVSIGASPTTYTAASATTEYAFDENGVVKLSTGATKLGADETIRVGTDDLPITGSGTDAAGTEITVTADSPDQTHTKVSVPVDGTVTVGATNPVTYTNGDGTNPMELSVADNGTTELTAGSASVPAEKSINVIPQRETTAKKVENTGTNPIIVSKPGAYAASGETTAKVPSGAAMKVDSANIANPTGADINVIIGGSSLIATVPTGEKVTANGTQYSTSGSTNMVLNVPYSGGNVSLTSGAVSLAKNTDIDVTPANATTAKTVKSTGETDVIVSKANIAAATPAIATFNPGAGMTVNGAQVSNLKSGTSFDVEIGDTTMTATVPVGSTINAKGAEYGATGANDLVLNVPYTGNVSLTSGAASVPQNKSIDVTPAGSGATAKTVKSTGTNPVVVSKADTGTNTPAIATIGTGAGMEINGAAVSNPGTDPFDVVIGDTAMTATLAQNEAITAKGMTYTASGSDPLVLDIPYNGTKGDVTLTSGAASVPKDNSIKVVPDNATDAKTVKSTGDAPLIVSKASGSPATATATIPQKGTMGIDSATVSTADGSPAATVIIGKDDSMTASVPAGGTVTANNMTYSTSGSSPMELDIPYDGGAVTLNSGAASVPKNNQIDVVPAGATTAKTVKSTGSAPIIVSKDSAATATIPQNGAMGIESATVSTPAGSPSVTVTIGDTALTATAPDGGKVNANGTEYATHGTDDLVLDVPYDGSRATITAGALELDAGEEILVGTAKTPVLNPVGSEKKTIVKANNDGTATATLPASGGAATVGTSPKTVDFSNPDPTNDLDILIGADGKVKVDLPDGVPVTIDGVTYEGGEGGASIVVDPATGAITTTGKLKATIPDGMFDDPNFHYTLLPGVPVTYNGYVYEIPETGNTGAVTLNGVAPTEENPSPTNPKVIVAAANDVISVSVADGEGDPVADKTTQYTAAGNDTQFAMTNPAATADDTQIDLLGGVEGTSGIKAGGTKRISVSGVTYEGEEDTASYTVLYGKKEILDEETGTGTGEYAPNHTVTLGGTTKLSATFTQSGQSLLSKATKVDGSNDGWDSNLLSTGVPFTATTTPVTIILENVSGEVDVSTSYNTRLSPVTDDDGKIIGYELLHVDPFLPPDNNLTRYPVYTDVGSHGTIIIDPADSVTAGTRVVINVSPDEGYALESLVVTDKNGDELTLTKLDERRYAYQQPTTAPTTVTATFAPVGGAVADDLPFTDVAADSWYHDAVEYAYKNGLMSGTGETIFSPNANTTRAMIVTILWRLNGRPGSAPSSFTDVDGSKYYANAVAWAADNGVVTGYSADIFAPDRYITREQMAAILYRYAQYMGYDTSAAGMALREFPDYDQISTYAVEPMAWANAMGLITGSDSGLLAPKGAATRAQVATILMRFCENIAD